MRTIAYLLHGSRREYHLELALSVLSVVHFLGQERAGWRIVLVCDEANRRPDLPVEHAVFTAADFHRWTHGGSYAHAVKVHALARALESSDGPCALVDTDTVFKTHPARLFERIGPRRSAMQADEGAIGSDAAWQDLIATVEHDPLGAVVRADAPMFNSGVVGLHAADAALLPDVTALIDALRARASIFNIEQFAFTHVLRHATALTVCPDVVHHYWGYERAFMLERAEAIFPDFDAAHFERRARTLPEVGFPRKRMVDVLRARWRSLSPPSDGAYRFAYLAALSAVSSARSQPRRANAWATLALDVVRKHGFERDHLRGDFARLLQPTAERWMDPETRAGWQATLQR
jgi:hypothetical protein